jgi:rhamnogalacturonyl hydrolase YesR
MRKAAFDLVCQIMTEFADTTGLTGGVRPRRYLWTDAFAVCNFLELYRQTGDEVWLQRAVRVVDQVHHTLGRVDFRINLTKFS